MSMIENAVRRVVEAMRDDPEFRARMQEDPNAAMAERGLDELRAHVRVVADTEETFHVVFPPAPNADLPDDELASVAGGFASLHGGEPGQAAYDNRWSRAIAAIRAEAGWSAT